MKYRLVGAAAPSLPKVVEVPPEVKQEVTQRVLWALVRAGKAYDKTFEVPTIVYDKQGKVAGTARFSEWKININSILLMENKEDMIEHTVPHEVAHLVAYKLFGTRIQSHGLEWQRVMGVLGLPADRCHQYDTTNSRVRTKPTVLYHCSCGKEFKLGLVRHRRHQASGNKTFYCKLCRSYLEVK